MLGLGLGLSLSGSGFAAPRQHGTWTPADLGAALVRDWNAASLSDGAVSSIADAIAGHALTQATGSLQPIRSATGFNGAYPTVTADGVDDYLESTVLTGIPTGATAGEIHLVGGFIDQAAVCTHMSYGGAGTTRRDLRSSAAETPQANDGATTLGGIAGGGLGNRILSASFSGTEMRLWVDGSPAAGNPATIATLATATNRIRFFAVATTTPANYSAASLTRAMITTILSDADKDRLHGYFAHFYNMLGSLPSNHPYKVWAP